MPSSNYKVVSTSNAVIFLYILKLDGEKHYTGITKDLFNRIKQHHSKGSGYTSRHGIVSLVYVLTFQSYKEARLLEVHVKAIGAFKYMAKIKFYDRYYLDIRVDKVIEQLKNKSTLEQLKIVYNSRTHF